MSQCKLSQKFDVDYKIQYWAWKMYCAATNTLKAHSVIPFFTELWTQREELQTQECILKSVCNQKKKKKNQNQAKTTAFCHSCHVHGE